MSNFFDGLRNAESYEHGKGFVRDQTYHLEVVDYIPEKATQKSGNMTLIEFRVIASSSPSAPPGTKLVRFRKHNPIAVAQSELIGFWKSVFGFTNSKEHSAAFDAQYKPHMGTYSQNAQYCKGKRVTLRTVTGETRDGHKFIRHDWSPLECGADGQPIELRQQPDPEPLKSDAPAPAALPPGGYGYQPPPQMQPYAQPPQVPQAWPGAYAQQPAPQPAQLPPAWQPYAQQPAPQLPPQYAQPVPQVPPQYAQQPVIPQQYAPSAPPQHLQGAQVPQLQRLPETWPANVPPPPGFTR